MSKPAFVSFAEKKLENEFELLGGGCFEDKKLYSFIDRAIIDLKKDPCCGIKIPRRIWPKTYVKKYGITNLWKYDLPNGWRVIYTIVVEEIRILSVILEWFDHPGYERRFAY
jgi:hypothetical protein